MSGDRVLTFRTEHGGVRADRAVADGAGCGRRKARRWIAEGRVTADGRRVAASTNLDAGVVVEVATPALTRSPTAGSVDVPIGARIVARTDDWLAVDKPAGIHTQAGRSGGTLAEFLAQQVGDLSGVGEHAEEFGTVHRLDRDTSGVVLVATTPALYDAARSAFGGGAVAKTYLAIVAGRVTAPARIDFALARRGPRVVAAGRHDRPLAATTFVRPLATSGLASLVEATSRSGAPHQIRVHLSGVGHPLFGDPLYGGPPSPDRARDGHLLHALRLKWRGTLDVSVAPAADFVRAWTLLGRHDRRDGLRREARRGEPGDRN